MELRHFRYFVAVAEEHSFAHAARRLRVAQPALSKQIRDLETELGVTLFERLPRGVRLTPAGEAFLADARGTLEAAGRAVTGAPRARKKPRAGGGVAPRWPVGFYPETQGLFAWVFAAPPPGP